MYKIDLNGQWKMKRTTDREWIPAKVPGSVYNDLLAAGKMEDPFYRDNEDKIRDISGYDFEYKRTFTAGEDVLACDKIVLQCEGLDTLCEIRLNGHLLGDTGNMHRTYEFDIGKLLAAGENNIHVLFRSPIRFIEKEQEKYPLWGIVDAVQGFPHLRKAHSMFGWDWGPQLPDMGIWRNISVRGYRQARLDDVYIVQEHEDGRVSLDIRLRCGNWSTEAPVVSITVTAPDGKEITTDSVCNQYESHHFIDVGNPELWWPNGYGKQPLYRVRVALKSDGSLLDEKILKIGLRTMRVRREKDQWGESFEFNVNGISIFAMGADYIPEDNILSRCSKDKTESLIKDCIAANFNCIRVWGGGFYPEDYFFELCDQYGLVVWQDLMFACALYNMTKEFAQNIKKEAEDNIRRIRHHASLGLWCGNNEMEMGWIEWAYLPDNPKLKADYIKQFEVLLAEVAEETDPETCYWPSSPSSGGSFDDPNSENRGDVHYWDVWHGQKPFTEYRKFFFRFASEFGFQSFPCKKTIDTFTLPEDRNIFSRVMEKHQKNGAANGKILLAVSENFKYPNSFDSLLYVSQLLQAEAMKYGVEHWRRNRGRCMGSVYWQLNDCWPVASWSSIDYYGRWKALHYFARKFYAPVLLSVLDEGKIMDFYITNETVNAVKGKVEWKLRNNASQVLLDGKTDFEAAPLSAASVCRTDLTGHIPSGAAERQLYLEYSLTIDGKDISCGTVLFTKAKYFEFLKPDISVAVKEEDDRFVLSLTSKAFAKYVELDMKECDGIFSDNYFDLSAGEARVIELKKESMSGSLSLEELRDRLAVRSIFDIA